MARIGWTSREDLDATAKANALEGLRHERDRALRESDWTQLADAPLSPTERQVWAEYRQDLRSLPERAEEAMEGRPAGEAPGIVRDLPRPTEPRKA